MYMCCCGGGTVRGTVGRASWTLVADPCFCGVCHVCCLPSMRRRVVSRHAPLPALVGVLRPVRTSPGAVRS